MCTSPTIEKLSVRGRPPMSSRRKGTNFACRVKDLKMTNIVRSFKKIIYAFLELCNRQTDRQTDKIDYNNALAMLRRRAGNNRPTR